MANGVRCFLVSFISAKSDGSSYTGIAGAAIPNFKYLNREDFCRNFHPDVDNKSLVKYTIITNVVEVNQSDYAEFFREQELSNEEPVFTTVSSMENSEKSEPSPENTPPVEE